MKENCQNSEHKAKVSNRLSLYLDSTRDSSGTSLHSTQLQNCPLWIPTYREIYPIGDEIRHLQGLSSIISRLEYSINSISTTQLRRSVRVTGNRFEDYHLVCLARNHLHDVSSLKLSRMSQDSAWNSIQYLSFLLFSSLEKTKWINDEDLMGLGCCVLPIRSSSAQ
jgi:hypothetical protein